MKVTLQIELNNHRAARDIVAIAKILDDYGQIALSDKHPSFHAGIVYDAVMALDSFIDKLSDILAEHKETALVGEASLYPDFDDALEEIKENFPILISLLD
jgi:hypothetical protein